MQNYSENSVTANSSSLSPTGGVKSVSPNTEKSMQYGYDENDNNNMSNETKRETNYGFSGELRLQWNADSRSLSRLNCLGSQVWIVQCFPARAPNGRVGRSPVAANTTTECCRTRQTLSRHPIAIADDASGLNSNCMFEKLRNVSTF